MYSIKQVAEQTGLSIHTLRYYENIGLIELVSRASNGHRRYSDDNLEWIEFLKKLRATGMPLEEMQHYTRLVRQGKHTMSERRAMLVVHRQRVQGQIDSLCEMASFIDYKIDLYTEETPACDID